MQSKAPDNLLSLRQMRPVDITQLPALRVEIERRVGRVLRTPSDFDWCSLVITEQVGERISPTTLKRLWGYLNEKHDPRLSTLNILARYLGANDWHQWLQKGDSGFMTSDTVVTARQLAVGTLVELAWCPDRRCRVEYLGDDWFVVRTIHKARLALGTRFQAVSFLVGHPLYLNGILPTGETITYVAGRSHGLTAVQMIDL